MSVIRLLKTLVPYPGRYQKNQWQPRLTNSCGARSPATIMIPEIKKNAESGVFPIRKQKTVPLSFPLASRDLEMFLAVHEIALDRHEKRCGALGRRIYIRAGSNQTLIELQSATREWFGPIPKHRIAGEIDWPDGARYASQALPIVFG